MVKCVSLLAEKSCCTDLYRLKLSSILYVNGVLVRVSADVQHSLKLQFTEISATTAVCAPHDPVLIYP